MSISSLLLLTVMAAPAAADNADLPLATNGKTGYIVVVPPRATPADHFAVGELIQFLNKSTGAEFRPGYYGYKSGKDRILCDRLVFVKPK